MLDHFSLASIKADSDTCSEDYFEIVSRSSKHTDEEDPCDPICSTYVLRAREDIFVRALTNAFHNQTAVEEELKDYIHNLYAPNPSCWCSYDCCGCRTGHMTIKHVAGAVFVAQSITARNY